MVSEVFLVFLVYCTFLCKILHCFSKCIFYYWCFGVFWCILLNGFSCVFNVPPLLSSTFLTSMFYFAKRTVHKLPKSELDIYRTWMQWSTYQTCNPVSHCSKIKACVHTKTFHTEKPLDTSWQIKRVFFCLPSPNL